MKSVIVALLGLLTCAAPSLTPPEGAWRSNRDITLAELRQERSFTPEQWRMLSSPELFGHMIYVLYRGSAITVYEGECSEPMTYEVDPAAGRIRFAASESDGSVLVALDGDRIRVPISILPGRLSETFKRTDLGAVMDRHPCVKDFVSRH